MARGKIGLVDSAEEIGYIKPAEAKNTIEKYRTEKCKVLSFNKKTKDLDIDFKGYGIRLNNVGCIKSDSILIKYQGEIGKPGFSCRL